MVDEVWPSLAPRIAEGLKKTPSETTIGDLWTGCRGGRLFLILAFDEENIKGITAWRLAINGYFECVNIVGKRADLWMKPVCEMGLAIAKNNGCTGIAGSGRTGWIRLMKKLFPTTKVVRQTYVVRCE